MKQILLISLFGFLFFSACATSPRLFKSEDIPSDSTFYSLNINIDEYKSMYPEDDAVFLTKEENYEHTGTKGDDSSWKFHKSIKRKYVLLNVNNSELTSFKLKIKERESIDGFYLITYSPSGEIKKYKQRSLKLDMSVDGIKEYKFAYPDIEEGTIIEEYYSLTNKGPARYLPTQHTLDIKTGYPIEKLKITLAIPNWWDIQFKNVKLSQHEKMIKVVNEEYKKAIFTYEQNSIPAYKKEIYSPFFRESAEYIECLLFKLGPGIANKINNSWEIIASELEGEIVNNSRFLSPRVKMKTREILAGHKTKYDSIKAIIGYIQKNIKKSEDGKKRNFSQILEDKAGNPWEICGLAIEMLREAEISTEYLLVHSIMDGEFDVDYVHIKQFLIPAVKISNNSENLIALPYYNNLPLKMIPATLQNQPALILKTIDYIPWFKKKDIPHKEIFEKVSCIVPSSKLSRYIKEEITEIDVSSEGILSVNETKKYDGISAYKKRNWIEDLTDDELSDSLKSQLNHLGGEVEFKNYNVKNLKDLDKPLEIILSYNINNLVTILPDEIVFQTDGILSPSTFYKIKIDPDKRTNPIKISASEVTTKKVKINFPENWMLETKLDSIIVKNIFGELKGSYTLEENCLTIKISNSLNNCFEPKEKINDLLKLFSKKSNLTVPALVFTNSKDSDTN